MQQQAKVEVARIFFLHLKKVGLDGSWVEKIPRMRPLTVFTNEYALT